MGRATTDMSKSPRRASYRPMVTTVETGPGSHTWHCRPGPPITVMVGPSWGGYTMVKHPRCVPFVVETKALSPIPSP